VIENGTIEYAQDVYYESYEKDLKVAVEEALAEEKDQGPSSAVGGNQTRSEKG
jgi:hypothetical protein